MTWSETSCGIYSTEKREKACHSSLHHGHFWSSHWQSPGRFQHFLLLCSTGGLGTSGKAGNPVPTVQTLRLSKCVLPWVLTTSLEGYRAILTWPTRLSPLFKMGEFFVVSLDIKSVPFPTPSPHWWHVWN